ncbi:MAG: AAA family ATPase [Actinomycetota bacterium]|nr:AAA family ATPase [Actinomycetota bacterium]
MAHRSSQQPSKREAAGIHPERSVTDALTQARDPDSNRPDDVPGHGTDEGAAGVADQAEALRRITASGQRVDAVSALAGSGKTTMIGVLATCYRTAG